MSGKGSFLLRAKRNILLSGPEGTFFLLRKDHARRFFTQIPYLPTSPRGRYPHRVVASEYGSWPEVPPRPQVSDEKFSRGATLMRVVLSCAQAMSGFFLYPRCCSSQDIVRFARSEAGVATVLRCAVGCTVCGSRSVAVAVLREPALLSGIQNHIFFAIWALCAPLSQTRIPTPQIIIILIV